MADFSLAVLQRSADNTQYEVQRYDVTGDLVELVGAPVTVPFITQDNTTIIRASHFDPNIVYLAGQNILEPDATRCNFWRLNLTTGTLTLLNVFGASNPQSTMVVDIQTEHDHERAWVLVGNTTSIGEDWNGWSYSDDPDGGLWMTEDGAPATLIHQAHVYPYHQYNILHFSGQDALAIGEFDGKKYAIHAMVENAGVFSSFLSRNDGSDTVWADVLGNDPPGTGTSNLGSIQYHTELDPPIVFFSINESGTGTFSFPATQQMGYYHPDSLTWAYPIAADQPTGLMGGLFYLAHGNGVMVQYGFTPIKFYRSTNSGYNWTLIHEHGLTNKVEFRGWELHRWLPIFVAGTHQSGDSRAGFLHWTLDEGATWHDAALGTQQPLALTITSGELLPPPVPVAWPTTATWRDRRGFPGSVTFYVRADSAAAARTQAMAIVTAIDAANRAALNSSIGAYTAEPLAPVYGSGAGQYMDIEDRTSIVFANQFGATGGITIPAPLRDMFLADGIILDPGSATVTALVAALLANGLCNRGGEPYVKFYGGAYSRSGTRRRGGAYTLDPSLIGPGI
jgi:hypothetical protein